MKIIKQLTIIISICLIGSYISSILPFSFPGCIISMIMLCALLMSGLLKEESIKNVADFLLINMGLFFIPAGVGILEKYTDISSMLWKFLLIIILSTCFTFFCASQSVTLVIYLQEKFKRKQK